MSGAKDGISECTGIMVLADAYDVVVTDRGYKTKRGHEKEMEICEV